MKICYKCNGLGHTLKPVAVIVFGRLDTRTKQSLCKKCFGKGTA